jgi:activator of HSP90 ATPase
MLMVIQQSVELPASPADLYAMYLHAAAHAAFTGGGEATISPTAGTKWSAFDGRIWGRVLALTPTRQIVQSWRSFEWHDGELDAVLVLAFTPAGSGARVDLAQVGVPDRLYDTLVSGWPVRYWDPWRAHLQNRAQRER